MASKEQIEQAIQAAADAGSASGYAQALEDVVGNLDLMFQRLESEGREAQERLNAATGTPQVKKCNKAVDQLGAQIGTIAGIRNNIAPEIENRKATAERELRRATALSQAVALVPSLKVDFVRRAVNALRLQGLLIQALGGAAAQKRDP